MEDKIIELEKKLINIENKVDNIYNLLNTDVKDNCEKMKEHIDFVDNVYDSIKFPLHYICNRISYTENTNVSIKPIADKPKNTIDNIHYLKKKNSTEDIKNNRDSSLSMYVIGSSLLLGYITYRYINR